MMTLTTTTLNDLPDVILQNIFSSITDVRTRNRLSLVSHKFLLLERTTRVSLTLRANARDLYMIPTCFRSVTTLDLSLISPWGHCLLSPPVTDPFFVAHQLGTAFPSVHALTVYTRSPTMLQILLRHWPKLRRVKLVRWHQRPQSGDGVAEDFKPIFEISKCIDSLDLSNFYYWTEDLPPVMEAYPNLSAKIVNLDLLTVSFTEGFKSHEIREITSACCNLKRFYVACMFDPRYIGFVGDETLLAIVANCPRLTHLQLVDTSSLGNCRDDPESDRFTSEDAKITLKALIEFFSGLPMLEELVLDVCKNVRDSGVALEMLNSKCPNLRVLKLGQFHGLCLAVGSQLDGIALCGNLQSLSIKNCADLEDAGLIAIGRGCCKLEKFEIQGCKNVTVKGLRTMASLLRKTLKEVKISCCKNLGASASLHAVEVISHRIEKLHIDCIWDELDSSSTSNDHTFINFELNQMNGDDEDHALIGHDENFGSEFDDDDMSRKRKKCKYSADVSSFGQSNGQTDWSNGFCDKSWDKLKSLSLWISVGELLTPLPMAGLDNCPNLEEIRIKIEGDCRGRSKPSQRVFGLSSLLHYPRLTKMQLDCGDTMGYALTAPSGQMDLSLWERFFLNEIGSLSLDELDYWPPQDRDVNQRSLSLPAAGLIAECLTLRKLFIHGTAHEHFMDIFLRVPNPNLRDVQLREDYYPAPENDMSTEMRVGSCSRFEDKLNSRRILD
ncbi:hypothetical protein ACFE04_016440 [Oxalis oulophora]